jgi:hypothetical protein
MIAGMITSSQWAKSFTKTGKEVGYETKYIYSNVTIEY